LSAPQRVYQVGDGWFPPLRSVDAVPTNLPVMVTELIGRGDERDRLVALMQSERLVTLTGVGGIGKTRLALAVAASMAPSFPDGCWFAELAPASTEDEVARAVAAAMGRRRWTVSSCAGTWGIGTCYWSWTTVSTS
jgi:hypothetical protein